MALEVTFDKVLAEAKQRKVLQQIENDVIRVMKFAGETFLRDARLMTKPEGGFGDVSGNLRASIGYFIFRGEEVVESDTGAQKQIAKQVADVVISSFGYTQKLKLIGVAGMDYASAVESRGLNVISVQGDVLIVDLEKYLKAVERKYRS